VVIGAFVDHLQDVYLYNKISKEMCDALNNKYGRSDADTELYVIEQ
jgi:hypothetical protein